jgi:prepilin-type processing-associated H-X9-DG protein
MLLPALAQAKFKAKAINCTSNLKQWCTVVNLYSGDDGKGRLPSFDFSTGAGGMYCWDVPTSFITNLAPYGLTIPMWFDPVRPREYEAVVAGIGHPPTSIDELSGYLTRQYNEAIINHNWWVPRSQGTSSFPVDNSNKVLPPPSSKGTEAGMYGWPTGPNTKAYALVPFVSCKAASCATSGNGLDACRSGTRLTVADDGSICPNTAHFFNGNLKGVNAAYADGHVESHNKRKMQCGYDSGTIYWFY